LAAYQTVFAREPGSSEMPSAARPFSFELVSHLASQGVLIAPLSCTAASPRWRAMRRLSPDRPPQVVDGLITGRHAPEASHLLLLESVVGTELVQRAYDAPQ
jgi:S-adenosylmethionine:tRNA ribosyltransferase-isomerase